MTSPTNPRRGIVWWSWVLFAAAVLAGGAGIAAWALPGSSAGEAAEVCARMVDERAQLPAAAEPRPADTVEVVASYRYRVTGVVDYVTGRGDLIRSAGYVCWVQYAPDSDRWFLVKLKVDD